MLSVAEWMLSEAEWMLSEAEASLFFNLHVA